LFFFRCPPLHPLGRPMILKRTMTHFQWAFDCLPVRNVRPATFLFPVLRLVLRFFSCSFFNGLHDRSHWMAFGLGAKPFAPSALLRSSALASFAFFFLFGSRRLSETCALLTQPFYVGGRLARFLFLLPPPCRSSPLRNDFDLDLFLSPCFTGFQVFFFFSARRVPASFNFSEDKSPALTMYDDSFSLLLESMSFPFSVFCPQLSPE